MKGWWKYVVGALVLLGVMLPNTPLHHLLFDGLDHPIVLTSGNVAGEPQCIDNDDARRRLASSTTSCSTTATSLAGSTIALRA